MVSVVRPVTTETVRSAGAADWLAQVADAYPDDDLLLIGQALDFAESLYQDGKLPVTGEPLLAHALGACLLYTSPSPRDATLSRMPSSA